MKKSIVLILSLAVCLIALGCSATQESPPATVIIHVDSPAQTVAVVSNKGTVEADGTTYTISLPDRRGAIVTVSADGFETVMLRFGASDFITDTIERTVELKTKQRGTIQLTVVGTMNPTVTAEGYAIDRKSNVFTITAPDREAVDVTVNVSADGCEPREIKITQGDLKGGYYFDTIRLAAVGTRLIEAVGSFNSTAFTRKMEFLTAEVSNDSAFFRMPSDDVLMLEYASGIVPVNGAEVETYGTRVSAPDSIGNQNDQFFESLYLIPDIVDRLGSLYVEQNGEYIHTWAESDSTGNRYLKIPGPCKLYAVNNGKVSVYDISKELIELSRSQPISEFTYESQTDLLEEVYKVWVYGDHDYEEYIVENEGTFEEEYLIMNQENTSHFDGEKYINNLYYRPKVTFEISFKGDLSDSSYSLSIPNSQAQTGTYFVGENITTFSMVAVFDDYGGISLTMEKRNGADYRLAARQSYYYYASEMTEADGVYSLSGLEYSGFLALEGYISFADVLRSHVDTLSPGGHSYMYRSIGNIEYTIDSGVGYNSTSYGSMIVSSSAYLTARVKVDMYGVNMNGDGITATLIYTTVSLPADQLFARLLSVSAVDDEAWEGLGVTVSETFS